MKSSELAITINSLFKSHGLVIGYAVLLLGLLGFALYELTRPVPWMGPAGLLLAAATPLGYLIWLYSARPERTEPHPVIISVIAGFGAVMSMVTVHRFGDDHQIYLAGALACLVGWLIFVRWHLRKRKVDPAD